MKRGYSDLVRFVILVAFVMGASTAALGEEFYKGKMIKYMVGYSPGGGYDTYTRAIARHIGKYIPGNPTSIVQNKPGGGSLVVANYLYNRARADGLTVGVFDSGKVLLEALGSKHVRFKARKFGWIGAPVAGISVCSIMGFTGLKTLEDIMRSKKVLKFGGTRPGSGSVDRPKIMNELMGTNFNVITGYGGGARIRIAMQRREVDGFCLSWESLRVTARAMLDAEGDDKLIPFIISGKFEDPEVKDLPRYTDVIKGEENLKLWNIYHAQYDFQRPLVFPPNTPKERLNIFRKAFKETLRDPEFLAETKKSKLLIKHIAGKEIEKIVNSMLAIPPAAKKRLQFLLK